MTASFWLRFRGAVRDRSALSILGNPVIAVLAGAVLIAVGFLLEPLIATGWWLLCQAALAVVALLWLRRVIHLGLTEEALEIPIGAPITCANCGAQTPRHRFCINCGVSLQALPKSAPAHGGPVMEGGPGPLPGPGPGIETAGGPV